ncbi:ABC transporter substrate-binding protein [Cupriavidus sp. 8B]
MKRGTAMHRMARIMALVLCCTTVPVAAYAQSMIPTAKILINTADLFAESGRFLAYDKGYFKEEGLDVELVSTASTNSSSDAQTPLARGEPDLGSMSLSAGLYGGMHGELNIWFRVNRVPG